MSAGGATLDLSILEQSTYLEVRQYAAIFRDMSEDNKKLWPRKHTHVALLKYLFQVMSIKNASAEETIRRAKVHIAEERARDNAAAAGAALDNSAPPTGNAAPRPRRITKADLVNQVEDLKVELAAAKRDVEGKDAELAKVKEEHKSEVERLDAEWKVKLEEAVRKAREGNELDPKDAVDATVRPHTSSATAATAATGAPVRGSAQGALADDTPAATGTQVQVTADEEADGNKDQPGGGAEADAQAEGSQGQEQRQQQVQQQLKKRAAGAGAGAGAEQDEFSQGRREREIRAINARATGPLPTVIGDKRKATDIGDNFAAENPHHRVRRAKEGGVILLDREQGTRADERPIKRSKRVGLANSDSAAIADPRGESSASASTSNAVPNSATPRGSSHDMDLD